MTGDDVLDIDPYYGHAIKDRPIIAIDRVRFVGRAGRRGRRGEPGDRRRGAHADRGRRTKSLPPRSRSTKRWRRTRPHLHDVVNSAQGSLPRARRDQARTGQRLLPPRVRAGRRRRRSSPRPISWSKANTPSRRSTSTRWNRTPRSPSGRGDDELTVWSSCQHPFLVRAEIADLFELPVGARAHRGALARRRVRQQVVHQDGADHRRRWPARPVGRCGSPTASTRRWSPPGGTA